MKKNYDFLGSGPIRRLQKAPKGLPDQAPGTGKDLPDRPRGGSDCSERGKTFQKL